MTSSEPIARTVDQLPEGELDELIVEAEDDPTPPDVAPQPVPVDGRPDVPRTLEGEPTDFAPLRVPVVDTSGGSGEAEAPAPEPDTAPADAPRAGGADDEARWQEIQVRFVDDPVAAVGDAAELVEGAVVRLREAYEGADDPEDVTEQLRLAFRRYRALHELATRPDDVP